MFIITRLILSVLIIGLIFILYKSFRKKIFRKKAAVFIVAGLILFTCLLCGLIVPDALFLRFRDPYIAHKYITPATDYDHEIKAAGKKSTLMLAVSEDPRSITPSLLLKKNDRWGITSPMRYTFRNIVTHGGLIYIDQITHPSIDEAYFMVTVFDADTKQSIAYLNGTTPDAEFTFGSGKSTVEDRYYIYRLPKAIHILELDLGGKPIIYQKTEDGWMDNNQPIKHPNT